MGGSGRGVFALKQQRKGVLFLSLWSVLEAIYRIVLAVVSTSKMSLKNYEIIAYIGVKGDLSATNLRRGRKSKWEYL